MTVRTQELILNIKTLDNLIKDADKMRRSYVSKGDLKVAANVEAWIKRYEEQRDRNMAEYMATINA
jgi:hypothetical protein